MKETDWQEDICKLKTNELIKFEAKLNIVDYNMKYLQKHLKNKIASNSS